MDSGPQVHWTEDADVVEQYVLGRIREDERIPLERHLQECAECRKNVEEERRVAAAVRSYGRATLKNQLSVRIAAAQPSRVPWPRVLAAAAVVMIAVGVVLYTQWTREGIVPKKPLTEDELAPGVPPPAAEEQPPSLGTAGAAERREPERQREAKPEEAAPQLAAVPRTEAAYDFLTAEKDEEGAHGAGATWVLGQQLARRLPEEAIDAAAGATVETAMKPEARQLEKGRVIQQLEAKVKTVQPPAVILHQQLISSMPASQRSLQRFSGQAVETRLALTDQGLQLTLYLDSLLAPAQLEQAVVEWVTADSLVVRLDGQSLGYQIPPAFQRR